MHLSIMRKIRRPFTYKGRFKSLRGTLSITHRHEGCEEVGKMWETGLSLVRHHAVVSLTKFLDQVLLAK